MAPRISCGECLDKTFHRLTSPSMENIKGCAIWWNLSVWIMHAPDHKQPFALGEWSDGDLLVE